MDEILEVAENTAEVEETEFKLATISAITEDGIKLLFDGTSSATDKEYKCNPSVKFAVGDRVLITKDSGTYIVNHSIGAPMEDYPLPSGGATNQVLTKASADDYDTEWNGINDLLPSGTTGQYLQKTSTGVQWADVTATTDKLTSGTYTVTLSSTTLVPNSSNTISLGTSSYPYKDLYANGTIKLGNSYGSYLGFFGTTPITRQSLPDSSTLANVITKLRNYGLFSQY